VCAVCGWALCVVCGWALRKARREKERIENAKERVTENSRAARGEREQIESIMLIPEGEEPQYKRG